MYSRKVGDEVLEFGHEGVLYRRSFIMYDKQTESLWLHVTGEALKGPMKGTTLDFIPSEVVPWKSWRTRHPFTKVLLGEKAKGFMGSYFVEDPDRSFGLSVGQGREVRLYDFALMRVVPVMNDSFAGKPVVIAWHEATLNAAAFVARADGRDLRFEAVVGGDDPRFMRDSETGSIWDRVKGECVDGELKGRELMRLPTVPWLVERWLGFFPEGTRRALPDSLKPAVAEKAEEAAGAEGH